MWRLLAMSPGLLITAAVLLHNPRGDERTA
jgi:hypothetical protein